MALILGLGELLWDLLPDGKVLGGAPSNFAYHCTLLGHRALILSRLGADPLGDEAAAFMTAHGLPTEQLQRDPDAPTGTVTVALRDGQPSYTIHEDVAWDRLEPSADWCALAGQADAICFGSLAQRASASAAAMAEVLAARRPDALCLFDVNLRQHYYSAEVLRRSLLWATVAKLNHEELPEVFSVLDRPWPAAGEAAAARELLQRYELAALCVTHSAAGSYAYDAHHQHFVAARPVTLVDAVGAGDAFTAGFCHAWLQGRDLAGCAVIGTRLGGWVASCAGGMPPPDPEILAGCR